MGTAEVSGLGETPLAVERSDAPRWIGGYERAGAGTIRFHVEPGFRYLAAAEALVPAIRRVQATNLTRATNRADYVIILPRAFLPAAAPLVEHRSRQGLKVMTAGVEEIYEAFGHGEPNPEALRAFLSFAYHEWRKPAPRYVLLLGDGSYDFKDYLGTGVENRVPPLMVKTSYLWTASDPAYAFIHGTDALPDVAIGRLPAASAEEARRMVSKIVAYEARETGAPSPYVLVADNPDAAGDFEEHAEELSSTVLAGHGQKKIYLSALGPSGARDAVRSAFDEGTSLVSYIGHGGIQLWANENIFDVTDVQSLQPQQDQPVLFTMNCLNGYFHFPYFDSLAEALVKAPDRGAIAAFSPSGLSVDDVAHRFHRVLLEETLRGGHVRLGDAVLRAQERFLQMGAGAELLAIYHLLGDPALVLR